MPATATSDSSWAIFCRVAQGSQGKYSQLSQLPTVMLMNAANVNDPLQLRQRKEFLYFPKKTSQKKNVARLKNIEI